jgi:DNA-binding NarL/FixJ family response regulator
MSVVRIGVLSDTRLFSEGVSRIVSADASLHLTQFDDEASLVAAPSAGRPQVVLIDSRMDGALAACQRLASSLDVRIIMAAVPDDGPMAADALIAGARGVLFRGARGLEVVQAIALVHQGKIWAPRHVVVAAMHKCTPEAAAGQRVANWQRLSGREREVLRHAAAGFANKELAHRLAISEATVKVHLTHIFQKVGCRTRAELAAAYHSAAPLEVTRAAASDERHKPVRQKAT